MQKQITGETPINKQQNTQLKQKRCSTCKVLKPATLEYFHKQARNKDGFAYMCKACKKQTDKNWRDKNEDYIKKYQKTPNFVFSQLKYQAKKRNYAFEITEIYYHEHLAHKPCFYCGEEDTKHWIDRCDNEAPYTPENTVPCCEMCNKMKSHYSIADWYNHCKKIVAFNS